MELDQLALSQRGDDTRDAAKELAVEGSLGILGFE
jgi:hypothetical protein